ncbi:hypothetical protein HU147_17905 [Planomicrobium chinense]|uniref:hypothetical protein n=1 Tax=Planococcus chinensis TaxID=272917 RepID=UPI001CC74156|nr:hypothetical protein [Planococcus chinensis]MBZ5203080.1 hypothetical protein [Planococcus chinensis]
MKDGLYLKVVLSGILICLIIIVSNVVTEAEETYTEVPVSMENPEDRIIQLAPNKIGIVDEGTMSGWKQLVIFEYNEESGEYDVNSAIPYEEMFTHPEFNDIPLKRDTYGN